MRKSSRLSMSSSYPFPGNAAFKLGRMSQCRSMRPRGISLFIRRFETSGSQNWTGNLKTACQAQHAPGFHDSSIYSFQKSLFIGFGLIRMFEPLADLHVARATCGLPIANSRPFISLTPERVEQGLVTFHRNLNTRGIYRGHGYEQSRRTPVFHPLARYWSRVRCMLRIIGS
jgi:hypothetical protein